MTAGPFTILEVDQLTFSCIQACFLIQSPIMKSTSIIKLISLLIINFFVFLSAATEINFSAQRDPKIDYRHYLKTNNSKFESNPQIASEISAEGVPYFATMAEMQEAFEYVRDRKTFRWQQMQKTTRRTTFLYPQDGCFLRAALMNRAMQTRYVLPLPKIYVFGNLAAHSEFDKNKTIYWYFHVALATKVGSDLFVIDPSLNYYHPLLLSEWLALMGVDELSAEVRLCDPNSYSPFDRCVGSDGTMENQFRDNHLQYYLGVEWNNLVKLGFNPYELLGEAPPWK
jgi:hypothetical protein